MGFDTMRSCRREIARGINLLLWSVLAHMELDLVIQVDVVDVAGIVVINRLNLTIGLRNSISFDGLLLIRMTMIDPINSGHIVLFMIGDINSVIIENLVTTILWRDLHIQIIVFLEICARPRVQQEIVFFWRM